MWLCVLCYIFYLYHIHILFVMTIHFSNNSGTGKWPLKGDKPLTWTRDPIIEPWLWEEEYNCILVGGFNPFEKYACQIGTLELPPPSIRLQSQCPLVDPNHFFGGGLVLYIPGGCLGFLKHQQDHFNLHTDHWRCWFLLKSKAPFSTNITQVINLRQSTSCCWFIGIRFAGRHWRIINHHHPLIIPYPPGN